MEPYVVETTFSVRYAETDAMGIVHNAVYPVWFEEGRSAWFRDRLQDPRGFALFEDDGFFFAVTELNARFIAPSRYGDRIRVRTWVTAVRSRGITVSYEVSNAESGTLLAKGHTSHVCLDRQGEVATIPPRWAGRFLS